MGIMFDMLGVVVELQYVGWNVEWCGIQGEVGGFCQGLCGMLWSGEQEIGGVCQEQCCQYCWQLYCYFVMQVGVGQQLVDYFVVFVLWCYNCMLFGQVVVQCWCFGEVWVVVLCYYYVVVGELVMGLDVFGQVFVFFVVVEGEIDLFVGQGFY